MKVAIVVDTCVAGGVSKALNDFIKCLHKELEITLFVRDIDTAKSFYLPEGVECRGWSAKKKDIKNSFMSLINHRNFQKKRVFDARQYKNIDGEYDCVIGYQMIANDVLVMALEKINAKRRVLWLHGKKNFAKKNMKFFDNLYAKADLVVAVSKDTEDRFKKLMPSCAKKTTTVNNFYDFGLIKEKSAKEQNDFVKKDNEIIIVSTGRLSKEKGFDRVPQVTEKLVKDGHNIKWYIAGNGEKMDSINEQIKERAMEDHIFMLGYRDNPYPHVKQCDIYVQPSYSEGFCTSTMEAKILKRPVVTTDVPGMNEQFDNGVDGLIVESSVDGIYRGIKELIESIQLYNKIIDNLNSQTFTNDEEVAKAIKAIIG